MVKLYKTAVSPILHVFGGGCRFYPTCSEYAMEAIYRHGAFKGTVLAVCRLLRCQPFCEGGIDYVPKKFEWRKLFKQNRIDAPDGLDK